MRSISVRAIIPHEDKFLLVNNRHSKGDFYCLPGGGVELGEEVVGALKREIKEELGVEATVGNLVILNQIIDGEEYQAPELYFHITNGADFVNIDLAGTSHGQAEIADVGFFRLDEVLLLPRELTDIIPRVIKQDYQGPVIMNTSPRDPITC